MSVELQQLKDSIVAEMDELSLLDILGLDINDLVDILEEQIEEAQPELKRALR